MDNPIKIEIVDNPIRDELKERAVKRLVTFVDYPKNKAKRLAEIALGYNVISPRMMSDVTGISYDTIMSKLDHKRKMREHYRLKVVYPFESINSKGQKMILIDDNCIDMIRRSLV